MAAYLVRRIAWMVVLLLLTSFVTFIIFYLLPSSDPALLRAGRLASPERLAAIRHQLALDRPFYVEYARFMERLLAHFDLGTSYQNLTSVRSELSSRFPA